MLCSTPVRFLRRRGPVLRPAGFALLLLICLAFGCATNTPRPAAERAFDFQTDTFAYPNALVWDYHFDADGHRTVARHEPPPDYTHHCFVVARSARQFFQHARFDPALPAADAATYRRLIRRVVAHSPRTDRPDAERIVIPGYANLRAFSTAQEALLKAECGSAVQSYVQRGHWRIVFPFSESHQQHTAERLALALDHHRPPVVHLVRFPQLSINHAVLLFEREETPGEIRFRAYDPNDPAAPVTLTYDRASRRFRFPQNFYFPGGRVDVYEVYTGWLY